MTQRYLIWQRAKYNISYANYMQWRIRNPDSRVLSLAMWLHTISFLPAITTSKILRNIFISLTLPEASTKKHLGSLEHVHGRACPCNLLTPTWAKKWCINNHILNKEFLPKECCLNNYTVRIFLIDILHKIKIIKIVAILTGGPWIPIPIGPTSPGGPCTPGSPLSP